MIKSNDSKFELDSQIFPGETRILDAILHSPAVCEAFLRLYESHESAAGCGREPWDFAVELSQLSEFGIGTHILRMMVCRKWITHMREITDSHEWRREFEAESDLIFSERSCFLLTKKGFDIAVGLIEGENQMRNISNNRTWESTPSHSISKQNSSRPVLCWDRDRRELRIGEVVVKKFKWPAENQEQVLDAFQEEGWPKRIDDPLMPHPQICAKRRLHDTLKCLNRKQANDFIKFRGDGTGQGVLLEINWDSRRQRS